MRAGSPSVKIALAAGLTVIAAAFAATLAHAPLTVARGNSTASGGLVSTNLPAPICQSDEALPQGTSAIRLALLAALGPRVSVRVLSGARVLTHGTRPAGWSAGTVTVPVAPVAHAAAPVKVCVALAAMNGLLTLRGWLSRPAVAAISGGSPLPGRMGIEYLRPSHRSWWSRAAGVIGRLDLGHALPGLWNALLAIVLALALVAFSSWLVVREVR
jgi:hypothetical protein